MSLETLIAAQTPDAQAIARYLDGLTSEQRQAEALALGGRAQARLFELVEGARPIRLDDLVPEGAAPMEGVTHEGRNSMLAFTRFAKVFYRPADGEAARTERWGYNRTSAFVTTVVGPGYYVASEKGDGEVLVDYTRAPPKQPDDGPAFLPNDARLSRFVYNGTRDVLRGVSTHVSIGRAFRDGKPLDNWFILCRV